MSSKVPAPWTPVKLKIGGCKAVAEVWGREYVWDHSLLPVSIRTAGREILSAPAALHALFDGEEAEFREISFLPVSGSLILLYRVFLICKRIQTVNKRNVDRAEKGYYNNSIRAADR